MTATWAIAIAASIGAGVIHVALGPEHVEELGWLGLGFYLAAALQLGWAVAAFRPSRKIAAAGLGINIAILAAWAVSRTVGLPAGETPWTPEEIGRADGVAALLEGALVVGLFRGLRPAGSERGAMPASLRIAPTVLAIAIVGAGTFIGLVPGGHAHAAGEDHHAADVLAAEPVLEPAAQPVAPDADEGAYAEAPTAAPQVGDEHHDDEQHDDEHHDDVHTH